MKHAVLVPRRRRGGLFCEEETEVFCIEQKAKGFKNANWTVMGQDFFATVIGAESCIRNRRTHWNNYYEFRYTQKFFLPKYWRVLPPVGAVRYCHKCKKGPQHWLYGKMIPACTNVSHIEDWQNVEEAKNDGN